MHEWKKTYFSLKTGIQSQNFTPNHGHAFMHSLWREYFDQIVWVVVSTHRTLCWACLAKNVHCALCTKFAMWKLTFHPVNDSILSMNHHANMKNNGDAYQNHVSQFNLYIQLENYQCLFCRNLLVILSI